MLRKLVVAAPLIAALMIVVLLVEPPALTPADRIPTLRVLTRPTIRLAPASIEAAIASSAQGPPPSYVIPRVHRASEALSHEPAGVVYTPSLRIAWAAYRRHSAGHPLLPADVPNWMAAPVVYVALRSPTLSSDTPFLAVIPAGVPTCCQQPQPTLAKPIWVSSQSEPIERFGAPAPFPDLGIVAAYPMSILEDGIDVVAFHRVNGTAGQESVEMRGRLRQADLVDWN